MVTENSSTHQPVHCTKRPATSDSRLETLKKFRVDKHSKRHNDVGQLSAAYLAPSQTQTQIVQKNNAIISSAAQNAQSQQPQRIPHINNCTSQGILSRSIAQPILAANVRNAAVAGLRTTIVQNASGRSSHVTQTCATGMYFLFLYIQRHSI